MVRCLSQCAEKASFKRLTENCLSRYTLALMLGNKRCLRRLSKYGKSPLLSVSIVRAMINPSVKWRSGLLITPAGRKNSCLEKCPWGCRVSLYPGVSQLDKLEMIELRLTRAHLHAIGKTGYYLLGIQPGIAVCGSH